MMKFKILPAPDILKNDVVCFRIAEHTSPEKLAITISLNGLPGIVFQHSNGRSPIEQIVTASDGSSQIPTLYVYGQTMSQGTMLHKSEPSIMTQVVFKPHALRSIFGLNATAATNNLIELNEFSRGDLNLQLLEAKSDSARVGLMTDFLVAQLEKARTRDVLIEESVRYIQKNIASISVKAILEHLSLSERQFEKRFVQTVGISPQFYIRIRRFNEALRLMKTRRYERLTDVAYALNYYDQSHFVRDIKDLSGMTPKGLSQKVADFYHDPGGYFQI